MKTIFSITTVVFFLLSFQGLLAQSITVSTTDYKQTIDMIGGDMERSASAIQSSTNTQQMVNWGFRDIDFNYCRVQYDKNQEAVEGVKNWGFYAQQVVTMKQIKAANPAIKFFATMRTDYDGFGNNNNAPDWIINYNTKAIDIDKYAGFLADYLEYMHDQDLTIHTLSITKEWTTFIYASRARDIIPKLHALCDARGVPRAKISDQGFWSRGQGLSYLNAVANLGTANLYDSFCSHEYNDNDTTTWKSIIDKANSLGKKLYNDESSTGSGGATTGAEPSVAVQAGVYANKAVAYAEGLNGEIFFEIWSRGINRETRVIYSPWQGTGYRMRGYYIMKHFSNNILNSRYVPAAVASASGVSSMTFRNGNQVVLWVMNESSNAYNSMSINANASVISGTIQDTYWTNSTAVSGATRTYSASGNSFNASIPAESISCFIFNVSDDTSFVPDPTKTYYIDNPRWEARLAANGDTRPYVKDPAANFGNLVSWKFTPAATAGYYYIDAVGGDNNPRLATDLSEYADVKGSSSNGSWTQWKITPAGNGLFLLTTRVNAGLPRLQVTNTDEVKMVPETSVGSWTQFRFTESRVTAQKSLLEINNAASVIYPNPVVATATLESEPNSVVTIFNMSGSVVFSGITSSGREKIDLSTLSKGIYYAEIKSGTAQTIIKLVKQ